MAGMRIVIAFAVGLAAAGQECGSGLTSCRSRESVLLQLAGGRSTGTAAVKTLMHTCETCTDVFRDAGGCRALQAGNRPAVQMVLKLPEMGGCEELGCTEHSFGACHVQVNRNDAGSQMEDLIPLTCGPPCVEAFQAADGCALMQNNSFKGVDAVMSSEALAGCDMDVCNDVFIQACYPDGMSEGFCDECLAKFEQNGGCQVVMEEFGASGDIDAGAMSAHIPDGCWPCGEDAVSHCMSGVQPGGEETAAPPSCHTATEGDGCFMNVRWAKERGAGSKPEWYPGLSKESSFEDFQQLLHSRGEHNCPEPCQAAPGTTCHTAVPGDECHHHVEWAMDVGIKNSPSMYPADLTENSSFEAFQAWLHHLHHGDCREPCPIAAP